MSNSVLYVDNTILAATARCTTKSILRYGLGMTTGGDEAAALMAGRAWHTAMEPYLRGEHPCDVVRAFEDAYSAWADQHVKRGTRLDTENVVSILTEWLRQHPIGAAPYVVDSDMVEVGFAWPLTEDGSIVYTGRLDAAAQMQGQQGWYPIDHKTTANIDSERVNKYQWESQMTGYIWALQHYVPLVNGALINMIELSKLPSHPKRKCRTHGVYYAECGPQHMKSQLFLVERTPDQIAQWKETAIGLARKYQGWLDWLDASRDADALALIPELPVEGTFNGSCEYCEFQQHCTMGKPLDRLQQGLVYSPWSPWKLTEEATDVSDAPGGD